MQLTQFTRRYSLKLITPWVYYFLCPDSRLLLCRRRPDHERHCYCSTIRTSSSASTAKLALLSSWPGYDDMYHRRGILPLSRTAWAIEFHVQTGGLTVSALYPSAGVDSSINYPCHESLYVDHGDSPKGYLPRFHTTLCRFFRCLANLFFGNDFPQI